ncbi:MAG: arginine--tRNA ligase [Candidatus Moduliflexus flocculans]|nr:arginine--tRNA ligase [Candidatus Moduliflexus flocculans]
MEQKEKYGCLDIGQGKKVQVEFVSANPTGPLHIGHARGAVVGDVIANLLTDSRVIAFPRNIISMMPATR